jgi:uncharacterized iron-regulated protein
MKKKILFPVMIVLVVIGGCKKKEDNDQTPPPADATEQEMLTDFANVLVNPNYQDLQAKAYELNLAVIALSTSTTQANLLAAQNAWRAVRVPWEQSEAYLFGPAEDFNYDPATDTWPVNTVELDSLLASSNPLTLADVDFLQYALKGYHPIEYVLFGVGSSRTAAQLTARQLQYAVSLSQSLHNATTALRYSWDPGSSGNFTNELVTAGATGYNAGTTRYATRKDAFLAIVSSMAGICIEVAGGKMQTPLDAHDSTMVESQYAHNATTDFRNNMVGVQNAYLCRYASTGKSIHDFVAAKDISLDNYIQANINSAIAALDLIDPNYGLAIFTQQGEIQQAQMAIGNLEGALNNLINFIQTNVTD